MIDVLHEPLPTVPANQIKPTHKPRVMALGGGGNAPGIVAAMVAYVQDLLDSEHDVVGLFGSWPALKNVGEDTRMIDFKSIPSDQLRALVAQGGTQLGVGRDVLWKNEFHNVGTLIRMLGIQGACGVGGDGTISAAQALQYSLNSEKQPLCNVIMGGKTIDNDMAHCDTAIGFMTSVFESQKAIHNGLNLAHGKSTTAVVDLYGRDNGHITLFASCLVQGAHPIITLIPEKPITRAHFLRRHAELREKYKYVCVAVAEGFQFADEVQEHHHIETDGRGNKKLEGGKLISNAIAQVGKSVECFKPGWDTRECPPADQDIILAQSVGKAVATLVKQKLWGTAIAAQGSFEHGFDLKPLPLWHIETGHPVPLHLYDTENLAPTDESRRSMQDNTNPPIRDIDSSGFENLRAAHMALMGKIQSNPGDLVEYNGIWIPKWAIVPDEDGREQVTVWTRPIGKLLAA